MSEGVAGLWPDDTPTPPPARPPEGVRSSGGRSRRGLVVGLIAGVVAVGAGTAVALGAFDGGPRAAAPTPETVVLPSPTPTVAPVAREPRSAFADTLPDAVLAYALTSFAEEAPLLSAGALEAYRLDYSDGGAGALTVLAGQWPTAEEAAAALTAATAGATPVDDGEPASGEVVVGGAPVGTWTLTQSSDGATSVSWTNGTVLLRAFAPADALRDVYAAYPL